MLDATRIALETCPECGEVMPVPKHLPFQRCYFRHRDNGSALSSHGHRGTWFACCRVWSISLGSYLVRQQPLGVYRPGGEWHWLDSGKDIHPGIWQQYDPTPLCERMDALSVSATVRNGREVVALHWKTNLVEGMHHEMFPFWLVTAGRKNVTLIDCTPFRLPILYWPDKDVRALSDISDNWFAHAQGSLHSPEVELPLMYHSHPTYDPEVRGAFRRFLDATFRPVPYAEREPLLLVCLRFNTRRWTRVQAGRFLALCRERLGCRIVVHGVGPQVGAGNSAVPDIPPGVEVAIDEPISAQVELARRATYCVIPHGAAFLWSWISGAPTLEMYPSPEVKSDTLWHFSTLPSGADVKRLITNGESWNADFNDPTAEAAFEAMLEHAGGALQ